MKDDYEEAVESIKIRKRFKDNELFDDWQVWYLAYCNYERDQHIYRSYRKWENTSMRNRIWYWERADRLRNKSVYQLASLGSASVA